MANYQVIIKKKVQKELEKLPPSVFERVYTYILSLSENPRPAGCKKLSTGDYRVRRGDYRIIYDIVDKKLVVKVLDVKHRKDAYRQF